MRFFNLWQVMLICWATYEHPPPLSPCCSSTFGCCSAGESSVFIFAIVRFHLTSIQVTSVADMCVTQSSHFGDIDTINRWRSSKGLKLEYQTMLETRRRRVGIRGRIMGYLVMRGMVMNTLSESCKWDQNRLFEWYNHSCFNINVFMFTKKNKLQVTVGLNFSNKVYILQWFVMLNVRSQCMLNVVTFKSILLNNIFFT